MVGGRGRDRHRALRPVWKRHRVGRAVPGRIPGQIPPLLRLGQSDRPAKRPVVERDASTPALKRGCRAAQPPLPGESWRDHSRDSLRSHEGTPRERHRGHGVHARSSMAASSRPARPSFRSSSWTGSPARPSSSSSSSPLPGGRPHAVGATHRAGGRMWPTGVLR